MPSLNTKSLVSRREVSAVFPPASGVEYDLKSFAYSVGFYALYFAVASDALPLWTFLLLGPFIFIRTLNALHESFHVRPTRFAFLHQLSIVVGPLQFGYGEYRAGHHSHHADPGGERDIEAYLVVGSVWRALFNALTQSEQGIFHFLRHRRGDRALILSLLVSCLLFAVMMHVGWGWTAVCYVIVTRVGNTFTWFMSHWVLHHPSSIDGLEPLHMPRALQVFWWFAFGPDGLAGARHHELHHAYPSVPDSRLVALMVWVRRKNASDEQVAQPKQSVLGLESMVSWV